MTGHRVTPLQVFLIAFVLAASALAQTSSDPSNTLFVVESEARLPATGWQAVEGAVEEFWIRTDPTMVAGNPTTLRVDLPFSPQLEAQRSSFVDYGPEWKSWFGTLRVAGTRGAGGGFVYLGYHGSRVTGILHFEGSRYQITGGIGGPQRLVRQSDELRETPLCGLHAGDNAVPLEVGASTSATEPATSDNRFQRAPVRIDAMALYPKAYFSFPLSEISVVDFVEDSIALANNAFVASNVNAFYNLVHVGPIVEGQPASNSLQAALDLLNSQPAEINTLRNAFGADFVTMFVPFIWTGTNACGVANLPVFKRSNNQADYVAGVGGLQGTALGNRTYSANRESCGFGDYTLAHEFGHNWGMWHSNIPSGSWKLLSANALAYEFTAGGQARATVMGCNCTSASCSASTAAVCNRVAHFSDPAITFMGVPTGTNATGSHPGRKNAQMARARLGSYPFFKPQSSNTPPVASFTISCNSSTRTCTFDASGTTDNGTITKYYWDFGDGSSQTTTSPTVNHTYGGSGNSYWIHLLATDNGNQRDLAINLVQL